MAPWVRILPVCALAIGAAASAHAAVLTATTTASIEPTGAYGVNGTYFNIRGPAKTYPQFGLVDITGFGALAPTTNAATLTITDSPYGSTVPGTLDFYLASDTATSINNLSFDATATANPAGVGAATGFAAGSVFARVGSAAYASTPSSPSGVALTYGLDFSGAASLYRSELAAGDVRLLITIDAGTRGAEPTFFGAASGFAPTLTVATSSATGGGTSVPEPASAACLGAAVLLAGMRRRISRGSQA